MVPGGYEAVVVESVVASSRSGSRDWMLRVHILNHSGRQREQMGRDLRT